MKGSVILSLVALTFVLVDEASSSQLYGHDKAPWMRVPHLLEELAKPIPGRVIEHPRKIFAMLFETIDKAQTDSRLQGFSVGQLLALNEWSVDDCGDNRLEERRTTCGKFSTREETRLISATKRGDDDQINLNLGKFCWRVIDAMERYCPYERILAIDKVANERLVSFTNEFQLGTLSAGKPNGPDPKEVALEILTKLEETDSKEAEALKETCSFIIDQYNKPKAYFHFGTPWLNMISACKLIAEINIDASL